MCYEWQARRIEEEIEDPPISEEEEKWLEDINCKNMSFKNKVKNYMLSIWRCVVSVWFRG